MSAMELGRAKRPPPRATIRSTSGPKKRHLSIYQSMNTTTMATAEHDDLRACGINLLNHAEDEGEDVKAPPPNSPTIRG